MDKVNEAIGVGGPGSRDAEALGRLLDSLMGEVSPLNGQAMDRMRRHLDSLTKPLGSLGRLEDLAVTLAGIYGDPRLAAPRKSVVIMAADNGVYEEGVSSCPQEVTAQVTENFMRGFTGINVFTSFASSSMTVVDIGVKGALGVSGILDRKVMNGTGNIAKGPAMTREACIRAILTGITVADDEVAKGANTLGTGEMGICNTATSSAVLACLSGVGVGTVTGRGSGLSDDALARKIETLDRAIRVNQPDPADPIDVVSKVGGLDIAGLMGVFIGGARARVPVFIDGFISGVAALAALRLCPGIRPYLVPSHASAEPGTKRLFDELGMKPAFDLGMRLGEGTGAALAMTLLDLVVKVVREMGTFEDAGIGQYVPQA